MEGGGVAPLEQGGQTLPQAIHARVSKLTGHRCDDGQVFVWCVEHVAVAAHLFSDGAQSVFTSALLELVEHDEVGHVEHLDFLKLRVRAELCGHHVQRMVGNGRDRVTALANAAGLTEDEVKTHGFGHVDGTVKVIRDFRARAAARQRAHEQVAVGQGVHADAVAQKCAARALSRRIDAQQADLQFGVVAQDAEHQFIEKAGFTRAPGSCESDDRHVTLDRGGTRGLEVLLKGRVVRTFREG